VKVKEGDGVMVVAMVVMVVVVQEERVKCRKK
jgi:hypothetical protein